MPDVAARAPVTAFRGALLVLCAVLSTLTEARTYAALPITLLGGLAFAGERLPVFQRHRIALCVTEALAVGVSIPLTGGVDSPLLPYLLVPPLCAALFGRLVDIAAVTVVSSAAVLGTRLALGPEILGRALDSVQELTADMARWALLGFALGFVASRARALTFADLPPEPARYDEVRSLLQQLRAVTYRLPGGLDAPTAAETLLEACAGVAPYSRGAVLTAYQGGALVPIGVRGVRRVPWRTPLDEPGPLQTAWQERRAVVDTRKADTAGRRRGSTLAVLPLLHEGELFGLVVLESFDLDAFPPDALARLEELVEEAAVRIETALLFDEVRSTATFEERERLARDMHDGIAQDLAFLGYQLDDLRMQAGKVAPALAERVVETRGALTQLISDLRLSITDLKTNVGASAGLGAAISSYVRAAGAGGQATVHLQLQESSLRLPADAEVLLFRVAQTVAQEVRRSPGAHNLWVTLSVDPPTARLLVEHDGESEGPQALGLDVLGADLERVGGRLYASAPPGSGLRVEVVLEGGS